MPNHDIIAIGASAGGVETVAKLIQRLPPDLPAPLFVVLHFPSNSSSVLPQILNRIKTLPAAHPRNGEPIQPGQIYVAPPNHHLLVQSGQILLSRGPRENGHRPAIDTLFRSVARAYGRRAVGIILSGMLDDGTAGLKFIHARGGVTIAQDPEEALFESMPRSAIEHTHVDYVLKVADVAALIIQLAHTPIPEEKSMSDPAEHDMAKDRNNGIEREGEIVALDKAKLEQGEKSGTASTWTCPDCGGVLWELQDESLIRFRCHTGHTYSLESLVAEQENDLERALWSATRALEEKAALARRMAAQAKQQNRRISETQFLERAQEAQHQAEMLRQMILQQTEIRRGNGKHQAREAIDRTDL
ncbi:chemotaxis protein CheB [Egbenema bharatensis]|uniref:chemotaxis protein CheB n=1 Tax=Egbenema bharatensis TaxID=3463334 RepID=UPI003A8BE8D1